MSVTAPRIGMTLGDPAGIGPELVLRALHDETVRATVRPVVYGSASLLRRVAAAAGIAWPADLRSLPGTDRPAPDSDRSPLLYDFPAPTDLRPGEAQAACGRLAATWIEAAARDCMARRLDAMVTGPICKAALHAAGIPYPGHTEFLAALTGAADPRMLFWSPKLVVGLVTIHEPLASVPRLLSVGAVRDTIRMVASAAPRPGADRTLIGVLGLNPHGGEQGLFGAEESDVIAPAIAAARQAGIACEGPLVPDTAFRPEGLARYSAYVAMYHDQGLIPFKLLAFDEGVNVTLGLPIVRTSPDHGTAFDLAWKGTASPSSLLAAIGCACAMVRARS